MRHLNVRIKEWLYLATLTSTAQVVVQGIGFLSGLLVIRILPLHEYALYTLANTMLGTMTILADGGIATGVMSQGGRVWKDKDKLGAVIATGMALRRQFAVFSLLVASPILFFLLLKHGASLLTSTLVLLSLIPAFFSALSGKLLEIPLKLHQDIKPIQRYQIEANIGRLLLLGLTIFIFPVAALAILSAGLSQVWNNWKIRRASRKYADNQAQPDYEVRDSILVAVRNLLPMSIYYCVSGQLSIWVIAAFGSTDAVAQIGALGRLAAIISVFQAVITTLLVPRFVRSNASSRAMLSKFVKIEVILWVTGTVVVLICAQRPDLILKLLGDGYETLTTGLVLVIAASCAQLISTTTHQMLAGRGLIVPAKILIPCSAASQILLLLLLKPNTVESVLLFSLFSTASVYVVRIIFLIFQAKRNAIF